MQEVVIDVREHPRGRPEVIECTFEAFGVGPVLGRSNGRVRGRDLEDDGRLLVRDGRLRRELVRERVAPREVHPDFREPELEELELSEVLV